MSESATDGCTAASSCSHPAGRKIASPGTSSLVDSSSSMALSPCAMTYEARLNFSERPGRFSGPAEGTRSTSDRLRGVRLPSGPERAYLAGLTLGACPRSRVGVIADTVAKSDRAFTGQGASQGPLVF